MTRTAFINRFKNHVNISVKNNADNALLEVLINRHTCKQRVDHEIEVLKYYKDRTINTGVHRVCQIEFIPGYGDLLPGI